MTEGSGWDGVEGPNDAIGPRLEGTYRLDEPSVLEESRLILDVIARDPCLDLISQSL